MIWFNKLGGWRGDCAKICNQKNGDEQQGNKVSFLRTMFQHHHPLIMW